MNRILFLAAVGGAHFFELDLPSAVKWQNFHMIPKSIGTIILAENSQHSKDGRRYTDITALQRRIDFDEAHVTHPTFEFVGEWYLKTLPQNLCVMVLTFYHTHLKLMEK